MSTALAFVHHLAAFALVGALAAQWALLGAERTAQATRRLRVIDGLYGAAALVLLVAGLLRVFYFEKGAAYYFQSAPFLAKLALFVAVGLLSIYPTLAFRRWARAPGSAQEARRLRALVGAQLGGVALILLFAALMARGIGFLG